MNRKEAAELLPIIQAYAEGKSIEFSSITDVSKAWREVTDFPLGMINSFKFRIKPEPTYRPFANADECWNEMQKHQPFIKDKVIESSKDVYLIIQRIKTDGIETDVERLDFKTAFEWFTFADGTPFGVKVEE